MGDWCTYGARDGYALPMVLTVRLPFNNLLFFGRSFLHFSVGSRVGVLSRPDTHSCVGIS